MALFRLDLDRAAQIGDDAVHGGQAETGPLTSRLGREEPIEDPGPDLLVHPGPGVGDGKLDIAAGRPAEAPPHLLGRVGDAGADGERSAGGHGIPGVHGEVQQHLLKLAAIAEHRRQRRGRQVQQHPAPAGQARGQQVKHSIDQGVQVDRRGRGAGPAAEPEQVAGQVHGAVRRVPDLPENPPDLRVEVPADVLG